MRSSTIAIGVVVGLLVAQIGVVADSLDPGIGSGSPPTVGPGLTDQAARLGVHRVTDVYAGDSIITSGNVTTYAAITVRSDPGTYAKLVSTVRTGESSPLDGLSSNGRASLTDGREVAGDYYASYVPKGSTLVFDRYVFFQDDLETARSREPRPSPTARPTARPGPSAVAARPTATARPTASPRATQAPKPRATPKPRRTSKPRATPTPTPRSTPAPTAAPSPVLQRTRVVEAAVALAAQADPLARIEVLRGRRVDLWIRATLDGAPAAVRSWNLAWGEAVALGPISGTGDEPFAAMWDRLAPAGMRNVMRFLATVEVPGEAPRTAEASIEVTVR